MFLVFLRNFLISCFLFTLGFFCYALFKLFSSLMQFVFADEASVIFIAFVLTLVFLYILFCMTVCIWDNKVNKQEQQQRQQVIENENQQPLIPEVDTKKLARQQFLRAVTGNPYFNYYMTNTIADAMTITGTNQNVSMNILTNPLHFTNPLSNIVVAEKPRFWNTVDENNFNIKIEDVKVDQLSNVKSSISPIMNVPRIEATAASVQPEDVI